ncbi:hypothetical protein L9F63_024510, partial [Diploptera punctata]
VLLFLGVIFCHQSENIVKPIKSARLEKFPMKKIKIWFQLSVHKITIHTGYYHITFVKYSIKLEVTHDLR